MIIAYGTGNAETIERFIDRRARACRDVKRVRFPENKRVLALFSAKTSGFALPRYMFCPRENLGKSAPGAFHRLRNF